MMRIRSIKPEIHTDEDLWDLEQQSGLPIFRAFTALWSCADREGRFEWRPRALKALCLPYWDGDFSRVLDALATRDFVLRYTVDGRDYGLVRTFTRHQIVNNRETESQLPEPQGFQDVPRVPDACPTREEPVPHASSACTVGRGKGREGEREEEREGDCDVRADAPPAPRRKRPPPKDALALQVATAAAWDAYRVAFRDRYGVEPIRNAKVNGQLRNLTQRLPADDLPAVIRVYLASNYARYVGARHPVGLLLLDAESLHVEWQTGQRVTTYQAREADKRQGRGDAYRDMIEQMRAEEAEAERKQLGGSDETK